MNMEKIVKRIETCEMIVDILSDYIVDFFHHRGLEWIENPFSEYPHTEILMCEIMDITDIKDIKKYEKTFCDIVLDIVVDEIGFYMDYMEEEDTVPTYMIDVLYLCEQLCDSEPVESIFYPTTGFVVDEEKKTIRRVE